MLKHKGKSKKIQILSFTFGNSREGGTFCPLAKTKASAFSTDGSPEPASIDNISVEPFPILVQNGASVTLAVQANKRKKEKKNWQIKENKKKRKKEKKTDRPGK